jgi:hypothetical protein
MKEATQSLGEAESRYLAAYRNGWPVRNIVELKVEWGDFDGADSVLRQVEDGEKMNALLSVAHSVVENRQKNRATAWANRQISPRDGALVLIGIANALSSHTGLEK